MLSKFKQGNILIFFVFYNKRLYQCASLCAVVLCQSSQFEIVLFFSSFPFLLFPFLHFEKWALITGVIKRKKLQPAVRVWVCVCVYDAGKNKQERKKKVQQTQFSTWRKRILRAGQTVHFLDDGWTDRQTTICFLRAINPSIERRRRISLTADDACRDPSHSER